MNRRLFFLGCLASVGLPFALSGCERASKFVSLWNAFRERFVAADGRIVDVDNDYVSHSEGQGWGMLFAVAAGDEGAFRRIYGWTRDHLQIRDDALFAWRYQPDARPQVADLNNASDGDIFIAWALLQAAERLGESSFRSDAGAILADLDRQCVIERGDRLYLLPGSQGFIRPSSVILNPSYFVFPALHDFAAAMDQPRWRRVAEAGKYLLDQARFGRFSLPADWVSLSADGHFGLPEDFPGRFGWEAVRIPVYARWAYARGSDLLELFHPYLTAMRDRRRLPAWIDLRTSETAGYPLPPGGHAAMTLAAEGCPRCWPARWRKKDGDTADQGYYGSALRLLSQLAQQRGDFLG